MLFCTLVYRKSFSLILQVDLHDIIFVQHLLFVQDLIYRNILTPLQNDLYDQLIKDENVAIKSCL